MSTGAGRLSRPSSATSHSSRLSHASYGNHSSQASRASHLGNTDLKTECKAAYVCVFEDTSSPISSKQEFILVLQQTGRNPLQKVIRQYWESDRDSMSFEEFVDVCRKIPPTTEDDLMKAFKKIDINGDGYISLDELYKIMTTKGERMTRQEVKAMIDEVDTNKDGRLDYKEFCRMFMSTTEECKKLSLRAMEKKEQKRKRLQETPVAAPRRDRDEGSLNGSELSIRSSTSEKIKSGLSSTMSTTSKSSRELLGYLSSFASPGNGEMGADVAKEVTIAERKATEDKAEQDSEANDTGKIFSSLQSSHQSLAAPMRETATSGADMPSRKGSTVSLKEGADVPSSRKGSTVSLKEGTDVPSSRKGSTVSLKEGTDVPSSRKGSMVSLKQGAKPHQESPSGSLQGSRVSLLSQTSLLPGGDWENERKQSQSSLRSDDKKLSQASLRSAGRSGSKQSLLSIDDLPKPSPRGGKTLPLISSFLDPAKIKNWHHCKTKGCFFVDENKGFVSHQYQLRLTEDTIVWITIQPLRIGDSVRKMADAALYVLSEDDDAYVAFTEQKDSKGCCGVRCELTAGFYTLVPFTTGCRLQPRLQEPSKEARLVTRDKENKVTLSKPFVKVLEEIFDISDLDSNSLLSREEFNWFNIRTSDEAVADDEWQVVEENVELAAGEITKHGFITLNQMEAEDNDGDTEDLWITLNNMGYNKALEMDEACPFLLNVYAEDGEAILKVTELENPGKKLENAVCASVIAKGEVNKLKALKDLTVYTYVGDARATVVVDNKSRTKMNLELDFSKSRNCISNLGNSKVVTLLVQPFSKKVAAHFLPEDERDEWSIRCAEPTLK